MQEPTTLAKPPSLGGLFAGFFSVGIIGFGGVLPWARRMLVEQRRWLSPAEFVDLLGLCQFLPGPNIINLSVAVGARFHGWRGSLAAYWGLMAGPMAVVLVLGAVYERFAAVPAVAHGLGGLAAAASGLVLATALKIAAPLRHDPIGLVIAGATIIAVAVLSLPLLPVMLVLAPLSIFVAQRSRS